MKFSDEMDRRLTFMFSIMDSFFIKVKD